ncbi:hypothetical protein D3C87_1371670 [compost metagenome]
MLVYTLELAADLAIGVVVLDDVRVTTADKDLVLDRRFFDERRMNSRRICSPVTIGLFTVTRKRRLDDGGVFGERRVHLPRWKLGADHVLSADVRLRFSQQPHHLVVPGSRRRHAHQDAGRH